PSRRREGFGLSLQDLVFLVGHSADFFRLDRMCRIVRPSDRLRAEAARDGRNSMKRTGCALGVLLGFMGVSTPAIAADSGPYMWGAGFKLGTSFIPGRYPFSFPSSINNYDFTDTGPNAGATSGKNEGRDLTADGKPGFTTLEPV